MPPGGGSHETNISTHAPVKGATDARRQRFTGRIISTHAPVKGATDFSSYSSLLIPISTHAPVKGATAVMTVLHASATFQPTHP